MEYSQIFKPSTLAKLNKKSQDNLKTMLGDKTLMQTMIQSQELLGDIEKAEAPYKDQLEELAKEMVEKLYPIIEEEGIKLDAKIVGMNDVNSTLDEIKINKPVQYTKEYALELWNGLMDEYKTYFRTEERRDPDPNTFISNKSYTDFVTDKLSGRNVKEEKWINILSQNKELFRDYINDLLKLKQIWKEKYINEIKVNNPKKYTAHRRPEYPDSFSIQFGNNDLIGAEGKNYPGYLYLLNLDSRKASHKAFIKDLEKRKIPIIKKGSTIRIPKEFFDITSKLEEEISPESRRRIINGITQGAALRGAFSFYLFKDYLDAIDPSLIDKYNQIMKNSFGVYDDDNAIAMMLSALAQGQKSAGGSSKVIINEIKVNSPNQYIFKCDDGSSHMGTLYFNNQIVSTNGHLMDLDSVVEIGKPKINLEDFNYFYGGYRLKKPFIIQNQKPINEQQDSGITIQSRALNFPMLVHELIKGLYELVSLQGFKGDKEANQGVVDKVDKLKHEPHDIKYGKLIFDALNDIFADSPHSDPRIREFFFSEVYQLEDDEFLEFVENAINEELSPGQKKWVNSILKEISLDLRDDDFDSTGLDEIKINNPSVGKLKGKKISDTTFNLEDSSFYNGIKNDDYITVKYGGPTEYSHFLKVLKDKNIPYKMIGGVNGTGFFKIKFNYFDIEGLDEIKINNPSRRYNPNYKLKPFEKGNNLKTTIINCLKANPNITEGQVVDAIVNKLGFYGVDQIANTIRKIDQVERVQVPKGTSKVKVFIYYLK